VSSEHGHLQHAPDAAVSEEALARAEEFIEEEEGHANKLKGLMGVFVTLAAVGVSLFHLYAAYEIVPTQTLRPLHVSMILALCSSRSASSPT
jgi:TRAP-type uncharacterized transport system fused permease subunit